MLLIGFWLIVCVSHKAEPRLKRFWMMIRKKIRESNYWVRSLEKRNYLNNYPNKLVLFNMSQSIVKLLTSIIKVSREKNK